MVPGRGVVGHCIDRCIRKTPTTPNDKLSQVVTLRLDQLPAPTWKTFIDAARPINRALAERVENAITADSNLGEGDSRAVTDKFKGISARYYQFGIGLNISPGELDGIRNETSIHDLLQEVVHEFLRSPQEKYKPTWRTIVDAVFDINPALAEEIAKQHPATPVKPAPSSTSPLGISSSPIVQSPDLPTSSTTATGTKRAVANSDILDGDGTDSDDPLPPASKVRKRSNSVQATPVKPAPSSTSPLGISSSLIVQSPDLPTSSTTGTNRVATDSLDITDGDTDNESQARMLIDLQPVVDAVQKLKLSTIHQNGLTGDGIGICILDAAINESLDIFQNKALKPGMVSFVNTSVPSFHGTACAAVAAGTRIGVAPGAVLNVCVVSPDGKNIDMDGVLKALQTLLEHKKQDTQYNIDIISMSFGVDKIDEAVSKCIEELTELGVICVAAVGNSGLYEPIKFPASDKNVISVAACQPTGQPSSFNPPGNINVYAPGENIKYSVTGEIYTGTSAAAPIVAGIIALLLQCANRWQSESRIKLRNVDVLRKIFDNDLKAPGKDLLAPHTLLQRLWQDPEELATVLSQYIKL